MISDRAITCLAVTLCGCIPAWAQALTNGDLLEYEYDESGNRTKLTVTAAVDPGSPTVTDFTYDALNRLESVSDGQTTSYTYDPVGNLESVIYPNMTRAEYAYDNLNRLLSVTHYKNVTANVLGTGTIFSSFAYTLGPAGNRIAVTETLADGTVRDITYGYDDLYRLKREVIEVDNVLDRTVSYDYDKVGNRSSMTVADVTDGLTTVVYDYDERDRLNVETRMTDAQACIEMNPDGTYLAYLTSGSSTMAAYGLVAFRVLENK